MSLNQLRIGDFEEISVFIRSRAQIANARAAVSAARLPFKILDDQVETATGKVAISTMHIAKGLERG